MTLRTLVRSARAGAVIAAAMAAAIAPSSATAQNPAAAPSRQAEDRRVDESARQTQTARQTEPAPAAVPRPSFGAPARSAASPSFQRQAEPRRQPEPPRQDAPARQPDGQRPRQPQRPSESRQNDANHWQDPGPAWRSLGPAWRDLDDRPGVRRPGEDVFRAGPGTYSPRDRDGRRGRDGDSRRDGRGRGRDNDQSTTVYFGFPYAVPYAVPYDVAPTYVSPVIEPEPARAPRDDDRPLGFLDLRVQPRTAEVFIDGVLAGTVDDFGGRGARMLTAGPHRVEIVAPGYETVTFDVRVPEYDTVTFTRDLEPAEIARTPPAPPVEIPHKAVYVVPKCYIGDRPPLPSDLPAGCRVEDMRVIP